MRDKKRQRKGRSEASSNALSHPLYGVEKGKRYSQTIHRGFLCSNSKQNGAISCFSVNFFLKLASNELDSQGN